MPLIKAKAYTRITAKAQKSTGRPHYSATESRPKLKELKVWMLSISWYTRCWHLTVCVQGFYPVTTTLLSVKTTLLLKYNPHHHHPMAKPNRYWDLFHNTHTTACKNSTSSKLWHTTPPALPKTTIKTELTIQLWNPYIISKYTTHHDHRFALKRPGSMTVSHYDTFSRNHSCAHSVHSSFLSHWQLGEENKPSDAAVSCDLAMTKVSLVLQT